MNEKTKTTIVIVLMIFFIILLGVGIFKSEKIEVNNLKGSRGSVLRYPLSKQDQRVIEQAIEKFINENIIDIQWDDFYSYTTNFESLDGFEVIDVNTGFTGVANINDSIPNIGLLLTSGSSTPGDGASVIKHRIIEGRFRFDRISRVRFEVLFATSTNNDIFLSVGQASSLAYGFHAFEGGLFGFTTNSTQSSTTLDITLDPNTSLVLDARFFPELGFVNFYVNSVFKGQLRTNLPDESIGNTMWEATAKGRDSLEKRVNIYNVDLLQRRF